MSKFLKRFLVLILSIALVPLPGFSYEVPRQDAKAKYFYLFGPGGSNLDGKESDEFHLFVDVPEGSSDNVFIKVYDANIAGKLDQGTAPWDTEMEFSVWGNSQIIKHVFGSEMTYDGRVFEFGPFQPAQGEKVGDHYRFTLKVKSLTGDDLNMFNVQVSPDYAESFSDKVTFVLLPNHGDKMYFYPSVAGETEKVMVRNYDMEPEGGVSEIFDPLTRQTYPVKSSENGQWSETEIDLRSSDAARRLVYTVETTDQTNGHAGFQFTDEKGNVLPIYFKRISKAFKPKKSRNSNKK